MNRRRNRVDMEKIFATVISLAIMVALVVGVVSILRSNNSQGDENQNYIDLNQINEALNETEQNTGKQVESGEKQSNVAGNDEKNQTDNKTNDQKLTAKDDESSNVPAKEDIENGKHDVAKNTDDKGSKDTENVTKPSDTAATPDTTGEDGSTADKTSEKDNAQVAEQPSQEAGVDVAALPSQEDNMAVDSTDAAAIEEPGEATPVNASTATILGYNFNEESTMMWPAVGNVILNYNMTNTIYFPTLDVYRCNPAIIISAPEDSVVSAAADGLVIAVYETNETGLTMEIALGNDYVMTYGQLKNLAVGVGSQVKRGDVLGAVAAPSQYYTVEGSNLYFKLDKAGTSVNPMDFIEAE